MSSPPATATRISRGNKWAMRIIVTGLSLLVMLAVIAYLTLVMGHVEGEEIATETFQRRTFTYYQLPGVELQITGIVRSDATGDLEDYLITEKLISVAKPTTPPDENIRWDLIRARRFSRVIKRGEAEILSEYLDAVDSANKNLWVKWSEDNPQLAKIIWPAVVDVAQQELYIFVPEMLELAANSSDPTALKNALSALQSEQYLRVATTQQQLQRHALAVELFTNSLDRTPDSITALERRAKSLVALGKQAKADADLAQVRQLKRF